MSSPRTTGKSTPVEDARPDRAYIQRTGKREGQFMFPGTMEGGNFSYYTRGPSAGKVPTSISQYVEDFVTNDPRYQTAKRLGILEEAGKRFNQNFTDPMLVATRDVKGPIRKPVNPADSLARLEEFSNERQLQASQEEDKRALTQEIMEREQRVTKRRRNPRSLLAQLPNLQGGTLGTQQTLGA